MELSEDKLLPRRPYLFRAFYDWITDNQLTPLVVVDATVAGVQVPRDYIKNDKIVLNIAMHSVSDYYITNDNIEFNARFNGNVEHIYVPMAAIEAIYARENGSGLGFSPEPEYENNDKIESVQTKLASKPAFHVVK